MTPYRFVTQQAGKKHKRYLFRRKESPLPLGSRQEQTHLRWVYADGWLVVNHSNRNFRFSSQQPHTVYPSGRFPHTVFSVAGTRAPNSARSAPTPVPKLLTAAFPPGFAGHLSPFGPWIDFPASRARAIPPEAKARRSARAYCQITVSSYGSSPRTANNSGHTLPAVRPSSPAAAASWSTTSSRFTGATPAAATDSPGCRPAGSAVGWRPRLLIGHLQEKQMREKGGGEVAILGLCGYAGKGPSERVPATSGRA